MHNLLPFEKKTGKGSKLTSSYSKSKEYERCHTNIDKAKEDKKVMVCVSCDHRGIIPFQFLNPYQTLRADVCSQKMQQRAHENLLRLHLHSSVEETLCFS